MPTSSLQTAANVREQIAGADTKDDAVAVVAAAFRAKLETMLQLLAARYTRATVWSIPLLTWALTRWWRSRSKRGSSRSLA